MVEEQEFEIIITSFGERAYFEVLEYVFEFHSNHRANQIALDLLEFPVVLKKFPYLGKIEPNLTERYEDYRFLLFERTKRLNVKVIYYIDERNKTIYITDFFPCEMYNKKINQRK